MSSAARPSSRPAVRRLRTSAALASLAGLASACGGSDAAPPVAPPTSTATAPATRDSAPAPAPTTPAPPPTPATRDSTPAGPSAPSAVAGIRLAPRALDVAVGARARIAVHPVNAEGVPSLALLAGPVRLRVADPRVAIADTSGAFVVGVAAGTTVLHASVGELRDSIVVRVSQGAPITPAGPAVALRLYPRVLTVAVGRTAWVAAQLVDAAGRLASTQGGQATWRVGDASVVRVAFTSPASDTAMYATPAGVAAGTTWLHVAANGMRDSLPVTVLPGRDSVPRADTLPGPVTPAPARFTLTTIVFAPGTPTGTTPRDTALAVRLPGARVEVLRYVRGPATSPADSLGTPTLVDAATTDAQGQATFRDLASGFHRVRVVPPAGSGLAPGFTEFGPPRTADFRIGVHLARQQQP
jgi:hypothetical protein